jgi:hypothetical protein
MGYDIRCLVTDNLGRTSASNALRYDPGTASAVIDAWKINEQPAGALASITGSKTGKSMLQPTVANQPNINATSFNGTAGMEFIRSTNTFMSGNVDLSACDSITLVMGLKEDVTISNGAFGASVVHNVPAVNNGSFEIVSNAFSVTTAPFYLNVLGNGGSTAVGGKYIEESSLAGTPQVLAVCMSTLTGTFNTLTRFNNVDQSLTNYDNQCVPGNFGNALSYWGRTAGGGLKWEGVLGGAIIILTGSTSTNHLWSAENYIKNATGLSY